MEESAPQKKKTWSQTLMAGYNNLTTRPLLAKGKYMEVLKNQFFSGSWIIIKCRLNNPIPPYSVKFSAPYFPFPMEFDMTEAANHPDLQHRWCRFALQRADGIRGAQ